ncbi:DUF3999 domain-containing protein [soil metagenome]
MRKSYITGCRNLTFKWALSMSLLGPAAVDAQQPPASDTANDYTHALPLSVSGKQGVVSFRLPQSVYLYSRSPSLDDLRVFDANGVKLPFAMHVPPLQNNVQRRSVPVRIFPIKSNQSSGSPDGGFDLDVKAAPDGSLLSVRAKSVASLTTAGAAMPLVGLVLDARETQQSDPSKRTPIEALRFTLPPGTATYSAQVWLEVSDDLKQWNTIGAAELSWLVNSDSQSGTQTLANDRLEFEPRPFRYARLTWRTGQPIQFAGITAESISQNGTVPVLENLQLTPSPGKEGQDLVYQGGIAIPVEKIGLQFTESNVVMPASFGSYRELPARQIGQPTTWRFEPFTNGTFYQITQSGETRRSGDVAVPLTHLQQWVLRPLAPTSSKPALRLSWQPATLVFLASGKGPYTLAFGRDQVKSASVDLSQVAPGFSVQELTTLEQATAGVLKTQQGAGQAEQSSALAAGTSAQTRMWILWAVLLLGVAVLGVMGWKLFKQMK